MCKKKDISLIINEMMRLPGVLAYIKDVKIRDDNGNNKVVPANKISPEIVFDKNTFNFHVFPADEVECKKLSDEFGELRTRLILAFYEYFEQNSSDKICENFYKIYNKNKIKKFNDDLKNAPQDTKTIQFGGLGCATRGKAKTYKYIYINILQYSLTKFGIRSILCVTLVTGTE